MTDQHVSPFRIKGWSRLGLPGATAVLFATPMLWALGVFDGTAEPLAHSLAFGLAGMLLFGSLPALIGWALQGFLVRRRVVDDEDAVPHPHPHPTPPPPGRVKPH